ncbi:hypothetical protein C1646_767546 [Rhizophagus diaphanus]|nr:hypothetical protein C1646_767546 [Rhizophagus diaphanus] [Rhizophagus sp. MUCL 43196]
MSDNSVIEINDDADIDEINVDKNDVDKIDVDKIDVDKIDFDKIDVDKNDVDKIFTFDDEPHNGKPITIIEISPKETYLITYSEEDCSVVGWNVEDMDKIQLKFDQTIRIDEYSKYGIKSLCVSDDKKLAYIMNSICYVIDMNNKDKKIALDVDINFLKQWIAIRFYRIPEDYELISISKYDNVYLLSNDYIYEWNINTEKRVKIFDNNKDKNKFETKNVGIFSNEKFIFLKINDKIIVYSIELRIPIASLDINDDIQLYNFMNHTGLFLLPSLFCYVPDKGIWNSIKYCWNNKYKNRFNQNLFDEQTIGILNGRVWKSKYKNSDELNKGNNKIVECNDDDKKTYKYLNVHLFNLYMNTVSQLFQKALTNEKESTESTENLIKCDAHVEDGNINLAVFNKHDTEWNLICRRIENYYYPDKYSNNEHGLIVSSLFNNNDIAMIAMLTTFGILIYTFNENNTSSKNNESSENISSENNISKSTLPLPNYDSFRLDGWITDVKNNKLSLLKYGVELLTFAIKEHKLELIDDIYKKCMIYFKEDSMNNKSFLSIITSTMPLLDKYYPEYILRYSSETNMIIDSSFYHIEHQNKNLHLCSFFQSPQLANLSRSLLWTKFNDKLVHIVFDSSLLIILYVIILIIIIIIQVLIILLTLPLYLVTFYILSKYNFINDIYTPDAFSEVYFYIELKIFKFFKKNITTTPTITFMIPYINFVNYSKDYSWLLELIRPQPSPFTETINRNIYKTWNGEKHINEEFRQQLFIASIILGFIHLILEICQFFNNIIKWFYNFRNIFVLFIIIISFAHAFHILLLPRSEFSLEQYNINSDDPNNPWKLASSDSSALSNWEYTDNPSIAVLIVLFFLLIVVYLMNLLIGLLNIEIGKDNNRVSYLIQKAEILAEIELFYLLPHQRRWQTWFPEVIQLEIKRLIKEGEWNTKKFTEMWEDLLKELGIKHNPIDNEVIFEKLKELDDKKLDNLPLEELEKSYYEKLCKLEKSEKLGKLEKLDTLLKEMCAI